MGKDHIRPRSKERNIFLACLFVFVFVALVCETYLLHRTEQFFGGQALNRPFAVDSGGEIAFFFSQAFVYDVLFYGSLGIFISALPRVRTSLNPLQRIVLLLVIFGGVFGTIIAAKWKIYEYFKNQFDFAILKELTAGDLTNLFAWVSWQQFLLILILPCLFLIFVGILRFLGRFGATIQPWRLRYRAVLALVLAWAVLGVNHFATSRYEVIRFGLSSKISYAAVDSFLKLVSDFDQDGYGPLTNPPDPNNGDKDIHPYAVDYPGNGTDENGLAGDLPKIDPDSAKEGVRSIESGNDTNVILIVVETFRVDVIEKEIDGREVMPFLNSIAREHAYTSYAYSSFGVTARAIQSIFKGSVHYRDNDRSVADELRRLGYKTYVVSAQDETWGNTDRILGFDQFDKVFHARDINWDERDLTTWQKMNRIGLTLNSVELNEHIFSILDQSVNDKFFLYINYQDLHYPYYDPKMDHVFIDKGVVTADFFKAENRDAVLAQYSNGAHHLDKSIQALWDHLRSRQLDEKTLIVIVGDHPDSFYENGLLGHAWTLDEHQRRTPLFVINGRGRYETPVGQDEIANMILNSIDASRQLPPLSFSFDPSRWIFELTAILEQPRQIGWISPADLITYDFKTARVQLGLDAPWLKPTDVPVEHPRYALFQSLVHRWESELLTKNGQANSTVPQATQD